MLEMPKWGMLSKAIQGGLSVCISAGLTSLRNQEYPSKSSYPASYVAFPKPVGCLPEVGNLVPQIWPGPKFSWGHSRLTELGTAAFRVKSVVCWTDGIFYHFNCLWETNGQWFREIIFGPGAEKNLKFLDNLGEYKAIIVFYTQVQLKNIKSGEQTEMTPMIGHHWICKSPRRSIGTVGMVINESYISLGS